MRRKNMHDIVIAIYHYVFLSMMCKHDIIIGMHDWLLFQYKNRDHTEFFLFVASDIFDSELIRIEIFLDQVSQQVNGPLSSHHSAFSFLLRLTALTTVDRVVLPLLSEFILPQYGVFVSTATISYNYIASRSIIHFSLILFKEGEQGKLVLLNLN